MNRRIPRTLLPVSGSVPAKSHKTQRKYGSGDPFYSRKRWMRFRKARISENPICQMCGEEPSHHVHHIKPRKEYPELAFVVENVMCYCHSCHSTLEAEVKRNGKKAFRSRNRNHS